MGYARTGADIYRDLWISTKSEFSTKLIDTLPRSHPLYTKIAGNNNVKAKTLDGKRFVVTILARAVNNVKSIDFTNTLDTVSPQVLETIEVEPKLLYQGIKVNDKILAVNRTSQITNLLQVNEQAVREGFTREFARSLYEMGEPESGGKSLKMNGLPYMISDNPYAANIVRYNLLRGLSGDTGNTAPGGSQEFWRNRAGELIKRDTANSYTGNGDFPMNQAAVPATVDGRPFRTIQAEILWVVMTRMLLVLNGIGEVANTQKLEPVVDIIVMNMFFFELYLYARYLKTGIQNESAQKIDMGFTRSEFMGLPIYLDKNCPMDKIYFIDSSQIQLLYVPGENFKREVKEVPNEFAKNYITSFLGNYIIERARNCGVINLNAATATVGLPIDCNICTNSFKDYDYPQPELAQYADTVEKEGFSGTGEPKTEPAPYVPPTQATDEKSSKKSK
jgi:hypothetical protein